MTRHPLRLVWMSLEDFDGSFDRLAAELPVDEQERAARFRVAAARHRFVLARVVLRRSLGSFLDADPGTFGFSTGDRGKPFLSTPEIEDPPRFNLSHSGDVVALIVGSIDVGIDVECLREMPRAGRLAHRFFSPGEQSVIDALSGPERDHAFLRIWTQKEAYLKATGLGVGMPLREVETEPDPAAPPGLRAVAGDRGEAASWSLIEVRIPGAVCTVALRGPAADPEIRQLTAADLNRR